VDDLKIVGQLYLPGCEAPYPTVCVCHGIPAKNSAPGDTGYSLLAERICSQGFAAFTFNFRGTGDSGGNFDIWGWTRDLKTAIDYLSNLPEVAKDYISLLGFSGGAAVSVCEAAEDKRVSSVIACACPAEFSFFSEVSQPQSVIDYFRSVGIIREENFPESAEDWLNGFRLLRPIDYVAEIAPRPLLIVHGSNDATVEVSHAHQLYDKAGDPKQIFIIDGAGHRLRQDERAMAVVLNWLKSNINI
ncbi:MAG: alpha/beta fold hydrolase, partial [Dehalococcoidales bacterium]|nr:alpha/beta fold hydrolase [Dehalococcoidales bacterium]